MHGQTKTYTTIFLFIIFFHNTSLGDIQIKLTIIMLLPEVWINDNIKRSNRKKSETKKRQVASLLILCLLTVTPVTTSKFSSYKFKEIDIRTPNCCRHLQSPSVHTYQAISGIFPSRAQPRCID